MIKKINQYLLTRHPLLWNTRIIWMLLLNIILHLLFFASGFVTATPVNLKYHDSMWGFGGGNLLIFSILCSLLVLIIWIIQLLRNNAFKNFYRIDKWYQAKEFFILLVLILLSTTYYISFAYGARAKVKHITNTSLFVHEANIINHAMAYLPSDSIDYFILNDCENQENKRISFSLTERNIVTSSQHDSAGTTYLNNGNDSLLRAACERPDAFSYKNYCADFLSISLPGIISKNDLFITKQKWLQQHSIDSVAKLLQEFKAICIKYNIENNINVNACYKAVFSTPQNNLSFLIDDRTYYERKRQFYLNSMSLRGAFGLIYNCHGFAESVNEDNVRIFTVAAYMAVMLSILLFCYRRFSRKVFLFSIIGSIVWAVIVGLIMSGLSREANSLPELYITLCTLFFIAAVINLQRQRQKLVTGALLCWHIYLFPFVILMINFIIDNYYQDKEYRLYNSSNNIDTIKIMAEKYPVSSWVHAHSTEIIFLNLCFVIIYIIFVFNKLAKRWYIMPAE